MNAPHASGERGFTSTAMFIMGGLLVWIATFVFIYTFAAVACARGLARLTLAGVGIVPAVTTLASVVAALTTALLLRNAIVKRVPAADRSASFIRFIALATCAIALVALVLIALPALLVGTCNAGA
jgi:hypothetical protein